MNRQHANAIFEAAISMGWNRGFQPDPVIRDMWLSNNHRNMMVENALRYIADYADATELRLVLESVFENEK